MPSFSETRAEMAARRVDLLKRIAQIGADLERNGIAPDGGYAVESTAGRVLEEFLGALQRQLGTLESTIHRIDMREYDCCMQCGGTIRHDRLQRLPHAVNCASCSVHYPLDYIDQLRDQSASVRRTIFSVLKVLEEVVERCESVESSCAILAPTRALLADLGRELPVRFRMEEEGGYLAEALAVAPRFSRRATDLRTDHAVFVRRIAAIVKQAEAATPDRAEWESVLSEFRHLTLDLLAHEEAEADILESAFLDDIGASD